MSFFRPAFGQPAAARDLGGGDLKVILVRGDADIEKALANSKPWMLEIIQKFCDRAEVQGLGEKRKAADISNDSQGGSAAGDGASSPAGKEALPSVGIAKELSVMEILKVVAYAVREILFITTPRELHQFIIELCGSGEKRCGLCRLFERLFDAPAAPALVLKYLGECLSPTGLCSVGGEIFTAMSTEFGFANVMAVLLSVQFDDQGFEFSPVQVHEAAAGDNPDLIDVLADAGANMNELHPLTGRSPWNVAVAHEQWEVVKRLLEIGVDPWRKDRQGRTPVDDAAAIEEVWTTFAEYCDEETITDKNRESILFLCVRLGLVPRLTAVLQSGANLECTDKNGKGVFDHTKEIKDEEKRAAVLALMAEYSVLCAVATGKADLVAAAVAKGYTVNEMDQEGNSCLHIAAAKGSNAILRMLLTAGAKVSAKNKAGYTSVQLAVEQKHEATVEVLLEAIVAAGMDIDARYESSEEQGQTLLMRASALGLTSTAAKLLALGADIAAKDAAGRRALELAKDDATFEALKAGGATMSDMTQQEKNDVLIEYAKKGLAGGLLMALQAGAGVNHKDKAGNTAVVWAQNAQTIDLLKGAGATMPEFPEEKKNDLLIEYAKKGLAGGLLMALQAGADANHKGRSSWTALHWAAYGGHAALAQVLLGAGANINAASVLGYTPLLEAAYCNNPEVAKVLLANGAQVNVGDNGGDTALAKARRYGYREIEALLRQHGAE